MRPAFQRVCSTSSMVPAKPVLQLSPMTASTRLPLPARPRSGASSARRPPVRARNCRSNWAASRPSSCLPKPISMQRSKAWSTRSGSIRVRSVARVRVPWSRKVLPQNSMTVSRLAWKPCDWAIRLTSRLISVLSRIRCSCAISRNASPRLLPQVPPFGSQAGQRASRAAMAVSIRQPC